MTTLASPTTVLGGELDPGPMRTASTRRRPAAGRRVAQAPTDSPWLASDLLRSGTLLMMGLVGLAVCWYGISGQNHYTHQFGWLVGAVFSLVFSAFGIISWLLAGIREVHREMADVMAIIRVENLHQTLQRPDEFDLPSVTRSSATSSGSMAGSAVAAEGYVTNVSMTRVHRSTCQFVQGRDVGPISVADIERLGLTYCAVCC